VFGSVLRQAVNKRVRIRIEQRISILVPDRIGNAQTRSLVCLERSPMGSVG
jgi:hypothetical protein